MLLLRHLKSYLPARSILRGFVALHLCDFADAIRTGCAEAKGFEEVLTLKTAVMQSMRDVLRQSRAAVQHNGAERDAICAGCAETKEFAEHVVPVAPRCNPCGMFRNERKVIVFKRSCAEQ